jgi:hypothetical protein
LGESLVAQAFQPVQAQAKACGYLFSRSQVQFSGSQAELGNAFIRQAELGNHFRSQVQLGNEGKAVIQ